MTRKKGSQQRWRGATEQMELQITDEQLREVGEYIQKARDNPCKSTVSVKMIARRCETVDHSEAGIILSGRFDVEKASPGTKSTTYRLLE